MAELEENNSHSPESLQKQRLLESRVETSKLQLENKSLKTTVEELGTRIERLQREVDAYRFSWSWRLSRPVRVFSRLLLPIAKIPVRYVRSIGKPKFIAHNDLRQETKDVFVSTGHHPQLQIASSWRGIRPGWAILDIALTSTEADLSPILHAFAGPDGQQVFSYPLASRGPRLRERRIIALPPELLSLRFDLGGREGIRFSVSKLSVRNISKLGLVYAGFAKLGNEHRKKFFEVLLRGRFRAAIAMLRNQIAGERDDGAYGAWVQFHDTLSEHDLASIKQHGTDLALKPLISVLMPVYNPRVKYLRKALDSIIAQTYENWELCIADDASTNPEVKTALSEYQQRDARIKVRFRESNGHISAASNTALELVEGTFVALMDHDDALPVHALYMVAEEINKYPDADLIYTDEDKIDENDRRHDPHFKTDWNQELFYSQNFVAHLGIYRTSIVRQIEGFRVGFEGSQDYDFVLRFLHHTSGTRIRHIPHVLYHWRIFPGVASFSTDNPDASLETARRALMDYFAIAEPHSEVVGIPQFPSWWRIKRQPPKALPRVSLIVPTRDRLSILKVAIDGLLFSTTYDNLELIIVDNESVETDTLAYFSRIASDSRVKILRVAGEFNFSALNNRAAEIASGEILGFINNDIEVIHDDWLLELVSQVTQNNVGAVGAKLYYANDTIQHAGVILGLYGVAAHGHRHFPRNSIGYFGRPMLVQNMSAVTAACMLVPRKIFADVGGYDEANLTVGYNDVDLCLKIRAAGFDIVFTPFAELYHLESVSRGQNLTKEQVERDMRERMYMLQRWPNIIANDPFYSPNLSVTREDFSLAFPPRAVKPWRSL